MPIDCARPCVYCGQPTPGVEQWAAYSGHVCGRCSLLVDEIRAAKLSIQLDDLIDQSIPADCLKLICMAVVRRDDLLTREVAARLLGRKVD